MSPWQPGADLEALQRRAVLLAEIRAFFAARNVLEVETPLLCTAGVTDPAIESFSVDRGSSLSAPRFLQTSPEYAMKRLLAAGSGAIYQIARAFRDDESGRRHNPEFSLLEWYRPGFDHHALMDEVAELISQVLQLPGSSRISYRDLFQRAAGLDPFTASIEALQAAAQAVTDTGSLQGPRDFWLDLLLTHVVEPSLADSGLVFVYDYPPSQAALARVGSSDGAAVAQRFELYVDGVELANGYCELTDAEEQRQRFQSDNRVRRERGQPERPLDEFLLAALTAGMPACSGVALGMDRLLMLAMGREDIREVQAFSWDRS